MNVAPLLIALVQTATTGHGPAAAADVFPSHQLQLAAHAPDAQLAFHFGLTQPLLLDGFNAAVDLRLGRWAFSYSHGHGLDFGKAPGVRSDEERALGLRVFAPYSTGFGVGFTLIDELYVMVDFKLHHFQVSLGESSASYSTITIGGEVGYRFFVWKGFYVAPVLRFWPNVWDSAPAGGVSVTRPDGTRLVHAPVEQGVSGFFANVLVGWAFDL